MMMVIRQCDVISGDTNDTRFMMMVIRQCDVISGDTNDTRFMMMVIRQCDVISGDTNDTRFMMMVIRQCYVISGDTNDTRFMMMVIRQCDVISGDTNDTRFMGYAIRREHEKALHQIFRLNLERELELKLNIFKRSWNYKNLCELVLNQNKFQYYARYVWHSNLTFKIGDNESVMIE